MDRSLGHRAHQLGGPGGAGRKGGDQAGLAQDQDLQGLRARSALCIDPCSIRYRPVLGYYSTSGPKAVVS